MNPFRVALEKEFQHFLSARYEHFLPAVGFFLGLLVPPLLVNGFDQVPADLIVLYAILALEACYVIPNLARVRKLLLCVHSELSSQIDNIVESGQ